MRYILIEDLKEQPLGVRDCFEDLRHYGDQQVYLPAKILFGGEAPAVLVLELFYDLLHVDCRGGLMMEHRDNLVGDFDDLLGAPASLLLADQVLVLLPRMILLDLLGGDLLQQLQREAVLLVDAGELLILGLVGASQ